MSVRLNSLLEIALQVPQCILRCGDGLIHGRVNMMMLMCLISFYISSLQYTAKYRYGILVIHTILISTTTLNKQRRHTCVLSLSLSLSLSTLKLLK